MVEVVEVVEVDVFEDDDNIFQKQYRNKMQTELFWSYDGFFCFQRIKARIMLAVLNWNKSLK